MNRDDFDNYPDLAQYWLREDALRSLDYDVYFSVGTRYYCDAGCKVCYIKDHLKETKDLSNFGNDLDKHQEEWFKFFKYFGVIRTNDDLYYLKHNHQKEYEWYQKYGHMFELCITDNAIFRTLELDDINLASIADISISTDFLNHVGVEKVLVACKQLYDKFGVRKIKYIDCGHPELFKDIIEWANKLDLHNCVHHDFRTNHRDILHHAWAEYQNTWVINDDKGLMHIYRESVHLYYDRFFFSSDDATDLTIEPFYQFDNSIDIKAFMVKMLQGKQTLYNLWKNRPIEKRFRDYYTTTMQYIINENFNFIPRIMMSPKAKFFYKLLEEGWIQTPYGLLKSSESDKIIPIIGTK